MQAVRMHATGGPDVLRLEDAPTPEPGRNELLVRLRSAAVNRVDLALREGKMPIGKPFPHILGVDGAGAVVRGNWGDARPGDRVFVSGDTLGRLRDGTYAEYVCVPSSLVLPMPREMRYEDAAALGLSALTAWQALVDRASIQPGQSVLIHAAGGGVGVAAIQIAKLLGARVIATASTDAKLERARQLGRRCSDQLCSLGLLGPCACPHRRARRGCDSGFGWGRDLPAQHRLHCARRYPDRGRDGRRRGCTSRPSPGRATEYQCAWPAGQCTAALSGGGSLSPDWAIWWCGAG